MKLLYINANPKTKNNSHSIKVADAFVEEYKKNNPNDEIIYFDLYKEEIPFIDEISFNAWDKQANNLELNEEEQYKIDLSNKILNQFMDADKYVFASPLWNFSIPPLLKAYMDVVISVRKTFRYTEQGPIGLLKNKKALFVQASGGNVSRPHRSKFEHASNLMDVLFEFMGIEEHYKILVEGISFSTDNGAKIEQEKIKEAAILAKTF